MVEFKFEHPQAWTNLQNSSGFQAGLYGTMSGVAGGSLGGFMSSGFNEENANDDQDGILELNNLLNDSNDTTGVGDQQKGGEEPCFEIFYKQPKGKTKVRIFSVARKLIKL